MCLHPQSEIRDVKQPRLRRAFTLVELLVVVTIIMLLLSLLLPALKNANEMSIRVVCASNEHQSSYAALTYAADNLARLMSSRKTPWASTGHNPEYINTDVASPTDEWNVHRIQPYVDGFDIPNKRSKGVFLCPAVDASFYTWLAAAHWDLQWSDGTKFTQLPYCYYAGVDRWVASERRNGAERVLCETHPGGANRVMISDVLLPDGNGGLFRYNHGVFGWAWSFHPNNWAGGLEEYAPPSITGLNQAFGDGAVRWKSAGQIKTNQMYNAVSYPDPWVDRGNGDPAYF